MGSTGFITHKGKRIFFIDFSDCNAEEILSRIESSRSIIQSQPASSVLTLTYVRNARFDRRVSQRLKEYSRDNKPFVRAAAIVGLSGLMEIILHAVVMFTRRKFSNFEDLEEAKDWRAQN
jgi:hypothetical protein